MYAGVRYVCQRGMFWLPNVCYICSNHLQHQNLSTWIKILKNLKFKFNSCICLTLLFVTICLLSPFWSELCLTKQTGRNELTRCELIMNQTKEQKHKLSLNTHVTCFSLKLKGQHIGKKKSDQLVKSEQLRDDHISAGMTRRWNSSWLIIGQNLCWLCHNAVMTHPNDAPEQITQYWAWISVKLGKHLVCVSWL